MVNEVIQECCRSLINQMQESIKLIGSDLIDGMESDTEASSYFLDMMDGSHPNGIFEMCKQVPSEETEDVYDVVPQALI